MLGTFANAAAIIAGSAVGALIRSRLPQKYINITFQGAGLFTLVIGISMALKSNNMILIVVSVIAGALIGEALNLDGNSEKAANYLLRKFTTKKAQTSENPDTSRLAVEGFITATMLFCTGSMAILGAFEDGMGKPPQLLYTKSIIDGMASLAFASSFGISVALSAIPILIYQGSLTLFTAYIMRFMTDAMIADLTAVGGILLIGLAINILKIKDIKVINMLPALVIVVLLSMFV
jgi:uncharacterized membrane protein YqgA involved in biofilm formation